MKNNKDKSSVESAGHDVLQTAREKVEQVKSTILDEGGRAIDNIKVAAMDQLERGKNELASSIRSVEDVLHEASGNMENSALAPQVEKVADALHTAHKFVESHDFEDVGTALRRLSLKHPILFYSGFFALGFTAGRFLTASQSDHPSGQAAAADPLITS